MADATEFLPDRLEKVVRLLALADDIADHPYLAGRLALTGGTALNMFVFDAPRLSFDLDYNYIGALDRDTMKAERPDVEAALADVFVDHGLRVKKRPNLVRDHAGGKWDLRYPNAFGGSESLAVDVSYVRRVPLWPPTAPHQRSGDLPHPSLHHPTRRRPRSRTTRRMGHQPPLHERPQPLPRPASDSSNPNPTNSPRNRNPNPTS